MRVIATHVIPVTYPAYKASDIEWLGDVPEHWEIRRLKYLLRERDSRSLDGNEQLLRVSQYTGVTQRNRVDGRDQTDTRAESLVGYKHVRCNDLVVNIMLAWNGSMGVSQFHGIASPAYCVYQFSSNNHPWYFHHLLRSPSYKAYIKTASTGVVESRLRLYTDDLYQLYVLVPPISEQEAVVRYLDYMDRRVERYVRAKERLIELLEEEKRAIINQTVTRGLDPGVRLKPSGVEWLGDVPEHWAVKKATQLFSIGSGTTPPTDDRKYYGGDVSWITTSELRESVIMSTKQTVTRQALRELSSLRVYPEGSVAVAMYGATIGRIGVLGTPAAVNQACCVFSESTGIDPWFWFYWLQSRRPHLIALGYGGGQPNLSQQLLKGIRVPVPTRSEQLAIVEYLDRSVSDIDWSINRARRQIELMEEYRTRLIADVVTGKLDVRAAAAGLPDEGESEEG